MRLTHGDAKDHRPDLQQAVLARMGSQDGGVPGVSQRGDGHTADPRVFQERAEAFMRAFQDTPSPRDLVAEAQLSGEDHAAHRAPLGLITRRPAPLKVVSPVMSPALQPDTWQPVADDTRDQALAWCHAGMAQRWLVGSARAALERAEAPRNHATPREGEASTKPLCHRQAQRVATPEAAQEALTAVAKRWPSHRVESSPRTPYHRDAGPGRPTPRTPLKAVAWPIQAQVQADDDTLAQDQPAKAGAVLGTHRAARA
jgi:hypothetical protein